MEGERVVLLDVPIDIVPPEQLEKRILTLIEKPGTKQLILLSIWDFLRTKVNSEYKQIVLNADLVLPISKSLVSGVRFLFKKESYRYNPFSFIISVLGVLDSRYKTLYLLGSNKPTVMQVERNVRATFHGVHVVGRFTAFSKKTEKDVITAIYKASPALVLMSGKGNSNVHWVYRNRNNFANSLFLWEKNVFDIFAHRKRRISEKIFNRGLEIWGEIIKNPFKVFLIFPYMWYLLYLVYFKLFKTDKAK